MAKACLKKDLKNLENDIDDLIMLEDSARGTLCAIHKTIHSTDNFPCSRHKMLRLCPVPRSCILPTTKIPIRYGRKIRSISSPSHDRPKMCRTFSANEPCKRPCCSVSHNYCGGEGSKIVSSGSHKSKYVNVEKTYSCPGNMCHHNTPHDTPSNRTCTFTSQSSVHIEKYNQNLLNTDEVVSELKDEIERVKHQLCHLSQQKNSETTKCKISGTPKTPVAKQEESEAQIVIGKLRNENKRLKREIEAKRKLLERSRGEVDKAKDILSDYEKKVSLLHVQALKSSKTMKLSKEKFCNCLKEREEKIKSLKETNQLLQNTIKQKDGLLEEKEKEITKLIEEFDDVKKALTETCEKCSVLTESNQNFYESIEMLRDQLLNSSTEISTHKDTIKILEQKLNDLNCACKKVTSKTKKQREQFDEQIKGYEDERNKMSEKISELSAKLNKCVDLEKTIRENEKFREKCKTLEDECKELYAKLLDSEKLYRRDKDEMHKLIDELTTVVKENKVTILQMSEINKQQETIIKTQSMALLTKEEQLKLIEKESETFKIRTIELEKEVEVLKKSLSEPCCRSACLSVSRELEEIRNTLNAEKDTQLLKEKIIEDQSQTILHLQSQVKEKMYELNKAQSDTIYLEEEISKINEKLIRKHKELDKEVDEKENLIEKLRILECQKNQLTEEINDFAEMLNGFKKTCGDNEKRQEMLKHLENQIEEQKEQWELQKLAMAKEKQRAMCAAKFATQKLLDTVADFQRQVDAQKKVQLLLTKMLHEKDEQLRIVTSKISSINTITKDISNPKEPTMRELYFRIQPEKNVPSDINTNTNTSMYSSCSSCCKRSDCSKKLNLTKSEKSYKGKENRQVSANAEINQIFKTLSSSIQKIQEEPSRDLN